MDVSVTLTQTRQHTHMQQTLHVLDDEVDDEENIAKPVVVILVGDVRADCGNVT